VGFDLETDIVSGSGAEVMYPTYLPASGWCYPLPENVSGKAF